MQTDTTAGSTARTRRATTVCRAVMIWAAVTMGSTQVSGKAECPPLPMTWISNRSVALARAPDRMPKVPVGKLELRCMP